MNQADSQQQFKDDYGNLGIKVSTPMDLSPLGLAGMVANRISDYQNVNVFSSGRYTEVLTIGNSGDQRVIITAIEVSTTNGAGAGEVVAANSINILNKHNIIIWSAGDVSFNFIQHIQPEPNDAGVTVGALQIISVAPTTSGPTVDFGLWTDGTFNPGMSIVNQGSGEGLRIESNWDTSSGIPLNLVQNNFVSTNFKLMISFNDYANTLFMSNGTDPNGVLAGNQGDVCFNASGTGVIKHCVGGTVWA